MCVSKCTKVLTFENVGQNQRHEARERVQQLKTELHTRRLSRQPSFMSLERAHQGEHTPRREQPKFVGEFVGELVQPGVYLSGSCANSPTSSPKSPTNLEEETVLASTLAGEGERREADEAEVRHMYYEHIM
jgi:hypothetical protein